MENKDPLSAEGVICEFYLVVTSAALCRASNAWTARKSKCKAFGGRNLIVDFVFSNIVFAPLLMHTFLSQFVRLIALALA